MKRPTISRGLPLLLIAVPMWSCCTSPSSKGEPVNATAVEENTGEGANAMETASGTDVQGSSAKDKAGSGDGSQAASGTDADAQAPHPPIPPGSSEYSAERIRDIEGSLRELDSVPSRSKKGPDS